MSLPPKTTVVFLDLPDNWLVGIDLHFFQSTAQFKGIKLIPDGSHIVHWGKDSQSIRSGKLFSAQESELVICQWDNDEEVMLINDEIGELNVSATKARLGEYYSFMVGYPNPEGSSWPVLTDRISTRVTDNVLPTNGLITSTSTSKEENEILLKSLRESAEARIKEENERKGTTATSSIEEDRIIKSLVDQSFEELKFTSIDLKKSWKPGSTGREVTINSLDKSWYLNNVVLKSHVFGDLLGELQLSYVLMIIFANFSGAVQWKKLAELFLRCRTDVVTHPQRYIELFNIVYHQIKVCPLEYIDEFLERSFLQTLFGHFKRLIDGKTTTVEPPLKIAPQVKAAADRVLDTLQACGVPIDGNEEEDSDEEPTVVD